MVKHKNPKIEPVCAYCEYATVREDNDEVTVSCSRHKETTPNGHCFRFRYDPQKRIPKPLAPIEALDPESVLMD